MKMNNDSIDQITTEGTQNTKIAQSAGNVEYTDCTSAEG